MTETVAISDNRTRVNPTNTSPYNRIGLVVAWYDKNENGQWDAGEISKGSGSLQGPDVVLTAGHVIMTDGVWSHRVYYYPAKNGTGSDAAGEPYGQATSIAMSCQFKLAVVGGNSNYDYGIVVINRNIGALTGYNGKAWTSGSLVNKAVTMTGYPADKTGSLSETMWKMSGTIKSETAYKIYYDIYSAAQQRFARLRLLQCCVGCSYVRKLALQRRHTDHGKHIQLIADKARRGLKPVLRIIRERVEIEKNNPPHNAHMRSFVSAACRRALSDGNDASSANPDGTESRSDGTQAQSPGSASAEHMESADGVPQDTSSSNLSLA